LLQHKRSAGISVSKNFCYNFIDDSDEEVQVNSINIIPKNIFSGNSKNMLQKNKNANLSFSNIQTNNNNNNASNIYNKLTNKTIPRIFPHFVIDDMIYIIYVLRELNNLRSYKEGIREIVNTYYAVLRENKSVRRKYLMFNNTFKKKCMAMVPQLGLKEVSVRMKVPYKSLKRWMIIGSERKKGGGRKIKDPNMEEKLCEWYKDIKMNKKHVTAKMIKQKALEFSTCKNFIASKGWLEKFKKKYGIEISKKVKE
jgi:hypothetical protein